MPIAGQGSPPPPARTRARAKTRILTEAKHGYNRHDDADHDAGAVGLGGGGRRGLLEVGGVGAAAADAGVIDSDWDEDTAAELTLADLAYQAATARRCATRRPDPRDARVRAELDV